MVYLLYILYNQLPIVLFIVDLNNLFPPIFSPPLSNVSYFSSLQLTSPTNVTLWLLLIIIFYMLSSVSSIISLWSLVQFFVLTNTISCFAIFCLNVCTYEFCLSSFLHHLQTDLCNCLHLLSCHLRILRTLLVPKLIPVVLHLV